MTHADELRRKAARFHHVASRSLQGKASSDLHEAARIIEQQANETPDGGAVASPKEGGPPTSRQSPPGLLRGP